MLRCSPRDIRDSAAIGSPWVPVVTNTTRSGGIISAAPMSITSSSATLRKPRSLAMPMLRTIDRPTKETLRPNATDASMICCTRATLEAKHATITRPSAPLISRCSSVRSRSPTGRPGDLGVRRVAEEQVDAASPSRTSRQVGGPAVQRQLVELDVAGVQHRARAGVDGDRQTRPGIEWLTAKYSHSNTPCLLLCLSATSTNTGLMRCSRHFSATSASVNLEPTTGMSGRSLSRCGIAPMWSSCAWVSTSASTSSRRSSTWRRSGRIRSTPGSSWVGNSTPQSTISSRPRCSKTVMLRPISLMPPSAVTRRPPGASGPGAVRVVRSLPQHRGGPHVGGQRLDLFGRGGTCGSRGSPVSMPCSRSPSLANVTPPSRVWRVVQRPSVTLILRAVAMSPEVNADNMSRSWPAARWPHTLMKPTAPIASHGRFRASSPE